MMILTIAWRELRSLFLSPLAWAMLAVVQGLLALVFLLLLSQYVDNQAMLSVRNNPAGVTALVVSPVLSSVGAFVFMLVVPLLSMRLFSDERRNHSLTLLLSAPVRVRDIVLGKYLGLVGFLAVSLLVLLSMPAAILFGGHLDYGQLAAVMLGMALLVATFAAVGLYMSSLTSHPAVAAVSTIGVLLFLWFVGWAALPGEEAGVSGALKYLSMLDHLNALANGVFNTSDIAYYVLASALFLILAIRRLDSERLQQ